MGLLFLHDPYSEYPFQLGFCNCCKLVCSNGFQSVGPGPAAASSVGSKLLRKANSWAHLKPTELKTLRVGPSKLCFNKLSRGFCSSQTVKFENYRFILFIYIWGYSPFLNSWDCLRLSHCQSFVYLISFCFSLNCVVLIAFGFEILVVVFFFFQKCIWSYECSSKFHFSCFSVFGT